MTLPMVLTLPQSTSFSAPNNVYTLQYHFYTITICYNFNPKLLNEGYKDFLL